VLITRTSWLRKIAALLGLTVLIGVLSLLLALAVGLIAFVAGLILEGLIG